MYQVISAQSPGRVGAWRLESLEFNVSNLLRQDIGAVLHQEIDTRDQLSLDGLSTRRIRGSVLLIRTNFGILARVELKALVQLECDRCLERFDSEIRAKFDEEYLPVIDVASGRPVQSDRTDETFFISANHVVDLSEATRQYLLLAVPMHKFCREECLGLCSSCGSNRNDRECGCVAEEYHALSAIASLLSDEVERN